MKEKLTLSVDKEAKQRAKRISERTGMSVSKLFELFLLSENRSANGIVAGHVLNRRSKGV